MSDTRDGGLPEGERADAAEGRADSRAIDVTECPDCGATGRYDGRVLVGGRGIYTCPDCGTRWQNADEKPSNKGVAIDLPRSQP